MHAAHTPPVASSATRSAKSVGMTRPDRTLEDVHAGIEAAFQHVVAHAGGGLDPAFERRLDRHQRQLRALLGEDADLASDAIEAARRVMTSADPAAPLLMLAMARDALARAVRRHAHRMRIAA